MTSSPLTGVKALVYAMALAADRHANQRRKDADATPYVNHPLEVMRVLAEAGVTELPVLTAAALHDVLEDTETEADEIETHYGMDVARMVRDVTDDKTLPTDLRRAKQLASIAEISWGARAIRAADKICNIRDVVYRPPTKWTEARRAAYVQWAATVAAEAVKAPGLSGLKRTLDQLLGREDVRRLLQLVSVP